MNDNTKGNNRYTACDGKTAYKDRQIAERVAKLMNLPKRAQNRKDSGHAPARVYKCPYCFEWHITGAKDRKGVKNG